MRTNNSSLTPCLILTLGLSVLGAGPSSAEDTTLIALGIRGGASGYSPLGEEQQEEFQQYDVAAIFRLPWSWHHCSDLGLETRLIASAGAIRGAGETGFIGTLVPGIALTSETWRTSVDVGFGGGLFSDYTFGVQDFGGPFQFVGTTGIGFALYPRLIAGYRFQHFSDADIYGDGRGFDMNMLELYYRF